VEALDFTTTVGYGTGGNNISELGFTGKGPVAVITDLGVLKPDPVSKELIQTSLHPGVTIDQVKEATAWELKLAEEIDYTVVPTGDELEILRELQNMIS
jgi:acyl CoA:acetate/3-ketoacid CoA transferase beta subunit